MRRKDSYTSDNLNPYLTKIIKILVERDWSPSYLAKRANLGSSTVSNLFKRNNVPTVVTLEKICNVLNIPLSSFFKDIEDSRHLQLSIDGDIGRFDKVSKRGKDIFDNFAALPLNERAELTKIINDYFDK